MELLRDRRSEFDQVGVQPIGISRDSPWTHIAWTQALDLNFGLLSDWNGDGVHGFGIAFTFRGLKDVAGRSAFLVDEEGTASSLRGVREVVAKHGLFCSLYTDRGSHYFRTTKAGETDRGCPTQVGRALAQLGVEHIGAFSPHSPSRDGRSSERPRREAVRSGRSGLFRTAW